MPRKPLNQDVNDLMDKVSLENNEDGTDPNFDDMVDKENVSQAPEVKEVKSDTQKTVEANKTVEEPDIKTVEELNEELAHTMRQLDKITKLFNMTTQLYITDGPIPKKFNCIEDELEFRIKEVQRRIVKTYNAYNKMTELYVSDNLN